jgi:starch synthase
VPTGYRSRELQQLGLPYLNNRSADLFGILNGVDYEHWNPATDTLIPATYSPADLSGKSICKAVLQERFGLEQRADLPILGIVSRFAQQKGFNLLREALPIVIRNMAVQLVVLGTGDPETENFFHWLTGAFPGRAGSHIGFSNELSHLVEAGSDFFLMPSLYEPCGLNQSYSMKYATLPIVRATGGLDDTVRNYAFAGAEPEVTVRVAHDAIDQVMRQTIGNGVSLDW